mmetsp:Transcript_359/g.1001  ORF Transcript_359/g.1001 Transcript_359/m.1001 type:complete len:256 (+) Transcript_359:196-963(+)
MAMATTHGHDTRSFSTPSRAARQDEDLLAGPGVGVAGQPKATGRWSAEEHAEFLRCLQIYGREWKKVSERIRTRTAAQIRSHAQKYFKKIAGGRGDDAPPEAARAEIPGDDAATVASALASIDDMLRALRRKSLALEDDGARGRSDSRADSADPSDDGAPTEVSVEGAAPAGAAEAAAGSAGLVSLGSSENLQGLHADPLRRQRSASEPSKRPRAESEDAEFSSLRPGLRRRVTCDDLKALEALELLAGASRPAA